jgi:hypothetical protein
LKNKEIKKQEENNRKIVKKIRNNDVRSEIVNAGPLDTEEISSEFFVKESLPDDLYTQN